METKIIGLFLLLTWQSVFSQNKDIEVLKTLNSEWLNSYPTKDAATLNKIFADDFVLISHTGAKMTKRNIIDNLKNQETISASIDSLDVKLLTENVGVVTAYTTFVVKSDGKDMTGKNCYQDIYMKRNGKWVAVNAHVTLLSFK